MNNKFHTINLKGCSPTPLAHYLKALGILRLIAEQVDSNALGWWKNDSFWLRSKLDEVQLQRFFLRQYVPTPLVAPWNGGSGFNPKDNQDAMKAIESGDAKRFCSYRDVIAQCKSLLASMPEDGEKADLLLLCRNTLSDNVLTWLDAAFVLTGAGPKYPPLLGTGGNDGRLEFTNNFMQHLISLLNPIDGDTAMGAESKLEESLFAELSNCRSRGTIGQYDPGNLGGSNSGSGFDGYSTVNSWDYILMLEGAIMFAAASTKRLESGDSGVLAYPFCVRSAGVGYGSSSETDEASSRAEMWLPMWSSPASCSAITTLLSEGRVETRKRKVKNGVDFARAIASLGIDRGINEFQRYGFQQRNGLAYLAVPLGRFRVKSQPEAEELLAPLDGWLDRFRRAATGKTAPARAGRALRQLESSILNLCQRGDAADVQATLIALGEAEACVAISKQLRDGSMGSGIRPLAGLDAQWLIKAYDGSREFRLAATAASISHRGIGPLRQHLEPFDWASKYARWRDNVADPAMVWSSGSLTKNLNAILNRRLIDIQSSIRKGAGSNSLAPLYGSLCASLVDISHFIDGNVDDERIEALIKALCLLDHPDCTDSSSPLVQETIRIAQSERASENDAMLLGMLRNYLPYDANDASLFKNAMSHIRDNEFNQPLPDAAYAFLKICYLPHKLNDVAIVLTPRILRRAILGDGADATRLATRRLAASGFVPAADTLTMSRQHAQRTAAALLFPISKQDAERLAGRVLRQAEPNDDECVAAPG